MKRLILIAIRNEAKREKIQFELQRAGFAVRAVAGSEDLGPECTKRPPPELVLCEDEPEPSRLSESLDSLAHRYPEIAVALLGSGAESARRAMAHRVFALVPDSIGPEEVELVVRRADEFRRTRSRASLLNRETQRSIVECPIFGASASMISLLEDLEHVATLNSAVLIRGESGTGKEVIARALHAQSPQRNAPFAFLDPSMHSAERLETHLFGRHASPRRPQIASRPGLIQDARHGTLFIDGVTALPPALQRTLAHRLRGDPPQQPTPGIRLLASTSHDLAVEVRENRFSTELFSILKTTELRVPPLRDRIHDIPLLANHFVQRVNTRIGRSKLPIGDDALDQLVRYSWPGNVRELKTVMEAACLAAGENAVTQEALPGHLAHLQPGTDGTDPSLRHARRRAERAVIQAALASTGGNRTHAARRLEISHRSLLYKIKEFGLRG